MCVRARTPNGPEKSSRPARTPPVKPGRRGPHAINFSHPDELAHVIRLFMDDQPIVDHSDGLTHTHIYEIHRGAQHPPPETG